MFEQDLKDRLQRIFDFKDTSFSDPSDSLEQEKLFIKVDSAKCEAKPGIQRAYVKGEIYVYANADKLPFGYFAKHIERAAIADTSVFFFSNIDNNDRVTNNIVKRSCAFAFFFHAQYDPRVGEITSVTIEEGTP